jgi:hypothetical protein
VPQATKRQEKLEQTLSIQMGLQENRQVVMGGMVIQNNDYITIFTTTTTTNTIKTTTKLKM